MTGRQPGAAEPGRRRRVGARGLAGLALLAGALVVGAAGTVLSNEAARAAPAGDARSTEEPADIVLVPWWEWPPARATLWCGHDLHPVRLLARAGLDATREREYSMAQPRHLGDFDGDGKDDVLLRHADGRWRYYRMNGRRVMSSGAADLTQNLAWQIAGIGDFNGDGNDDVLLWHLDGNLYLHYYAMDGGRTLADSGPVVLPNFNEGSWERSVNWRMAVGDFDGDGNDDVLLRYSSGFDDSAGQADDRWHYYRMDGRRVLEGSGRARLTRDGTWRIAGIADLDRDGRDDVLLRKTDGRWYFYPMNGRAVLRGRGTVPMTRDLDWRLAGIGHFDRDVRKSALLRHPNGRWRYYRLQGRQAGVGSLAVDLPDDTSETVAGVGDLNGDGSTDVLMRRAGGGWRYHALYDGRPVTRLSGAPALSGDPAWGALHCGNLATGTTLPGRTLVGGEDDATSLSFLAGAFEHGQPLTHRVRSSDADVVRASVAGDVLTLMPVMEGTATVTATARDPHGNSATQSFAVRHALNTFQDCAECPRMVVVPAGAFTMGSPESEAGRESNEGPRRAVSIPAFAASAHEVTFAQWDACAAAGACSFLQWPDGLFPYYPDDRGWGRDDRPVIEVGWEDAQQYVRWLSRRSRQPYRLLTESEWEYAARAGTTTPFHTGETITRADANFDWRIDYPSGEYRESRLHPGQTVPVGSFEPNLFGLYDMHGNVSEWVQDCHGSYSAAPSDGSAAELPPDRTRSPFHSHCIGGNRVLRGGSWADPPHHIRSAHRNITLGSIGFRVARTL